MKKFAPRCHRHARFPAITWRHPRTEALLLRGGGFHGRGVGGAEAAASHEQEHYMAALVSLSPLGKRAGRYDGNQASSRRGRAGTKQQQHQRDSLLGVPSALRDSTGGSSTHSGAGSGVGGGAGSGRRRLNSQGGGSAASDLGRSDSSLSLNSLMMEAGNHQQPNTSESEWTKDAQWVETMIST